MKTFINGKRVRFYFLVSAIWLSLWLFNSFINNPEIFVHQSLNEIWRVIYLFVANYIFFEFSLPFIVKKRSNIFFNIPTGILLIALHLMVVSFGLYGWKSLGIQLNIYTSLRIVTLIPDDLYNKIMEEVIYQAQGGVTSTFFFGLAKLFYDNFKLRQTTQQLRLEKQEAELNYLKSQTNPHFLFNTLNNIYSLAKDKSDLAPESILRLSKILRFMLYETNGRFITIEQELGIINDYIALEKLRYDDSLRIHLQQEIEDLKQQLPPLLLVPLVENAFKHGVSETSNDPFVDIELLCIRKQMSFIIKNSFDNSNGEKNVIENIGLTNIRRQLELLYKDYNLSIYVDETVFTATLKINLASHV